MNDRWWKVEVSDHTGQIVCIETRMLTGREIGDLERKTIEDAACNLLGFIGQGYNEGFLSGARAMQEAAAKVADAYADANIEMAGDSVLTDPLLRGEPLTAENVKTSEARMIDGCVHSSMFHAAQNIAGAIRTIDAASLKGE